MSAAESDIRDSATRRRVRNGALGLACVALAVYLAFIALLVFRSHH
jgi:hypothetical protein